jgi:hypothetical protein
MARVDLGFEISLLFYLSQIGIVFYDDMSTLRHGKAIVLELTKLPLGFPSI